MTDTTTIPFHRRLAGWRIAGWSAAAALLALPAIAMRFTNEVNWTGSDFLFAAILLFVTGLAAEGALRLARSWPQLVGFGFATFTAFFTIWVNLAVGIIGSEDETINVGFLVLLLMAIVASAVRLFKPRAMSVITGVLAVSQLAMGMAAMRAMPGHQVEWGVLLMFATLWLGASLSFRRHAAQIS